MDLSKLPRFSQTPTPPAEEPAKASAGDVPATEGTGKPAGPQIFCQCGAPLPAGSRFCSHCGASYREATGDPRAREGAGGFLIEAFLSVGVGIFLLLMQPMQANGSSALGYWSAQFSGKTYAPYAPPPGEPPTINVDFTRWNVSVPQTDPATGQRIFVQQVVDVKYVDKFDHYWANNALTAFALVLIVEGVVLALVRNRWGILLAALLIAAATGLNIWYVSASYTRLNPLTNTPYGFPPFQLLAAIFGVVMAGYQFMVFKEVSRGGGK